MNVEKILKELNLPIIVNPQGYDLPAYPYQDRARLRRCSGIAGEVNTFRIVRIAFGTVLSEKVRTNKDLKRILLEYLTNEDKPEHTGYTFYARRHETRFGQSVIWVKRKIN